MDKRIHNGNKGHSTKSKGIDKRRNKYKQALNEALTTDDVVSVIKMIFNKAIDKNDIQAGKLILEYCLGRPKQYVDLTTDGDKINDTLDYSKLSLNTLKEIARLEVNTEQSESGNM